MALYTLLEQYQVFTTIFVNSQNVGTMFQSAASFRPQMLSKPVHFQTIHGTCKTDVKTKNWFTCYSCLLFIFGRLPSGRGSHKPAVYQLQFKGFCLGLWESHLNSWEALHWLQHPQPGLWNWKTHRPEHGRQCVWQPSGVDCFVWELPCQQLLSRRAAHGCSEGTGRGRFVADLCDDQELEEKGTARRFEREAFAGLWQTQEETRLGGENIKWDIARQIDF